MVSPRTNSVVEQAVYEAGEQTLHEAVGVAVDTEPIPLELKLYLAAVT